MDPLSFGRPARLGGYEQKSVSSSSSHAVWSDFFLKAGIPNNVANEYAVTFSQHRIRIDMLREITKEILLDMGIKAMGDIIAILRHAKKICTQSELKGAPDNATLVPRLAMTSPRVDIPTNTTKPSIVGAAKSVGVRTQSLTSRMGPAPDSVPTLYKVQSRINTDSGALQASSNSFTRNGRTETLQPNGEPRKSVSLAVKPPSLDSEINRKGTSIIPTSLAQRLKPSPHSHNLTHHKKPQQSEKVKQGHSKMNVFDRLGKGPRR